MVQPFFFGVVCGGELPVAPYGAINSPGYPSRYPQNRDCMWLVAAPLGKRLQFTFATLQLEHHPNCSFDFLEVRGISWSRISWYYWLLPLLIFFPPQIRDGRLLTDPVLVKHCSTSNPAPVISSGPFALVYFHSDPDTTDNGFHITYAAVAGIYFFHSKSARWYHRMLSVLFLFRYSWMRRIVDKSGRSVVFTQPSGYIWAQPGLWMDHSCYSRGASSYDIH